MGFSNLKKADLITFLTEHESNNESTTSYLKGCIDSSSDLAAMITVRPCVPRLPCAVRREEV